MELARKKKQALDDLFNSGKISASTYESLDNELTAIISDIEMRQKLLADNLASKVDDLEKQISTLEIFLANSEIQYVAGEIDEELHVNESTAFSNGLTALKKQLIFLKEAVDSLMPEATAPTPPPAPVEDATMQLTDAIFEETAEISVDAAIEAPIDVPIEAPIEAVIEAPVEETFEAPVEVPVEAAVEETVEVPVEETLEASIEETVEVPVEVPEVVVEEAVEETIEASVEMPVEAVVEAPVEETIAPSVGIPLKKYRIPKYLKLKRIDNLWKYDLPSGWRLLYSLGRNKIKIIALVLEWCDHDSYQKKYSGKK